MRETIYRKGFNGLIKDVDTKGRVVTGYFSTFNFKDSDGDIIMPGAFKKTVDEQGPNGKNRIYHLWQHQTYSILGKPTVLKEDEQGLYFETPIVNTSLGEDALKLYEAGILNEHSIGFNIVVAEWNTDTETNYIKEIRLWEGSAVTWGANENTPVVGMKSDEDKRALSDQLERIEKAMRGGAFTDDTFKLLEYELKYIKQALAPEMKPREPQKIDICGIIEKSFLNNL